MPVPLLPPGPEERRARQQAGRGHPEMSRQTPGGFRPPREERPRRPLASRIRRRAQRSVGRRIQILEQIIDSPLEETRDRTAAMRELVKIAALAGQNVEHLHRQAAPFQVRALVAHAVVPSGNGDGEVPTEAAHIELPPEST